MAEGQLKIRAIADTRQLQRAMDNTSNKMKQFGAVTAKAARMAAVGVGAAGAAAVAGAFKVASFGDEVAKSAQKAGVGVEQFQELRFAFGQGGVEADTFDRALLKFNKRLGESATTGGTADEAFAALGVSLRNADGNVRGASQAMDEVLPKLAGIKSDAERAAIAGDLFGQRAGPELAAALSEGIGGIDKAREKAQELGIVMGPEAAAKAEQFTDAWDDIKQSTLGLLRTGLTPLMGWMADEAFPFIQTKLIPALAGLRDWLGPKLGAAAEAVSRFFATKIMPALVALRGWWDRNGPVVKGWLDTLMDSFGEFGRDVQAWWNNNVSPAIAAFRTAVDENWPAIERAGESVMDMFRALGDLATTIFASVMPEKVGEGTRRSEEDFEGMGDAIAQLATNVEVATTAIEKAARGMSATWNLVMGGVTHDSEQTVEGLDDLTEGKFSQTMDKIRSFASDMAGDVGATFTGLKDSVSDRFDEVVAFAGALPGRVQGAVSGAWTSFHAWWNDQFVTIKDWVGNRVDDIVDFFRDLPGRIGDALGDVGGFLADKFSFSLPGISFSGQGDGPGGFTGPGSGGGKAMARAAQATAGLPISQSSGYRTPAENAAAGGSPTSWHLDKSNPASDWVGPTWALDRFAARLRSMGGWRELLWRVPNHAPGDNPHVHVAHEGGRVTPHGIEPLRADELATKLQVGETVRTREQEAALHGGRGGMSAQPLVIQIDGREVARLTAAEMEEQLARRERQGG